MEKSKTSNTLKTILILLLIGVAVFFAIKYLIPKQSITYLGIDGDKSTNTDIVISVKIDSYNNKQIHASDFYYKYENKNHNGKYIKLKDDVGYIQNYCNLNSGVNIVLIYFEKNIFDNENNFDFYFKNKKLN